MKIPSLDLDSHVLQPVLRLLWQQWSALGVAGHAGSGRRMVDPEALVLATTAFARFDARLFDESLGWLRKNGSWINVVRLSRLQKEHGIGDPTILGAIAEYIAKDAVNKKWEVLIKSRANPHSPQPLFPHLPVPNRPDERFASWGWLRGPIEDRGLIRQARPDGPAEFIIKLRALFGRQSRVEVLAWLLSHEAGHPAQIARETGYFRGSVQIVLNELEFSGHIHASRHGREKIFSAPRNQWRFLISWSDDPETEFPVWQPWAGLFSLLQNAYQLLADPSYSAYSEDLQAIEFNRRIEPIAARLRAENFVPNVASFPTAGNGVLLAEIHALLDSLSS